MLFRNLTIFRFDPEKINFEKGLAQIIASPEFHARDPSPMQFATMGWAPVRLGAEDLVYELAEQDAAIVNVSFRERLLPGAVVAEALRLECEAISERDGDRRIGAKERKQIRERLISEMLPRAFVRSSATRALVSPSAGWLAIDTSSRKRAEEIVGLFRSTFGRFPVQPLAPRDSARATMTEWLIGGGLAHFWFGDELDLRDPAEGGSTVALRKMDLDSEEIDEHVKSGKQVFRLGLVREGDTYSFVLGADLVLRKLRFCEEALKVEEPGEGEDYAAHEFAARAFLLNHTVHDLLDQLHDVLPLAEVGELGTLDGGDAAPEMKQEAHDATVGRDDDPLYDQAVALVRETRRVSISAVQRNLKIGYNRAARLVEAMEVRGVVSAPASDGTREVLAT